MTLGLLLGMSNMALMADEINKALPSIEMLEFLGQWETANGEWLDPASLKEISPKEISPKEISLEQQQQKQGEQND